MDFIKILFLVIVSLTLVQCASNEPKASKVPDVTEAQSADNITDPANSVSSETSEKDLQNMASETVQSKPDPIPESSPQAEAPVAAAPVPAPENAPEPSTPQTDTAQSMPAVSNEKPAIITALDFNANDNGGTVIVKTNRDVTYTTRKNEKNNQFVIELDNTRVPKKFQRPYNTKEFPGAIGSINAYQAKGSLTARIIVQLRQPIEPSVVQNGQILSISASGSPSEAMAANPQSATSNSEFDSEPAPAAAPEEVVAEGSSSNDGRIMSNKSFDSFLLGQNKFYGKPLSIEVTNQDVREVFKFISDESGLNIILDEDVIGKVTMKLRKVPWDQALAIILQSKQLGYVRNGSILRVATLKTLQTDSQSARKVIDSQKELQPLRVQIFPISYAKADEFATQIRDLLSTRGKATADKRTNTLVVTDIAEVLAKVKSLVTKLDTQTPQVLIEARIVEARDTFSKVVGVNWAAVGGSTNIGRGSGATGDLNFIPALSINNRTPSDNNLRLSVGSLDVLGNLSATLSFLENENQIKIISAPRITALDRVEANIEQTNQFPITTSSVSSTGFPITSVSFQDVKLQLKVTPQITADGGVLMSVSILREIAGAQSGTSGAREVLKRQASTQILVENGDTAVIGGIYQSDTTESENGVPWLRKIPFIGSLFKSHSTEKNKNELVIFLSPRILNRDKAFVKADAGM